jgi:hypothetical protein
MKKLILTSKDNHLYIMRCLHVERNKRRVEIQNTYFNAKNGSREVGV